MKKKFLNIIIFTAFFFIVGCSTKPIQTTENAIPGSLVSKLILRGDLPYVKFSDLRATQINNFLVVDAEIINTDSDNIIVNYRFQWKDKQGVTVGSEESWKTLPLSGMQTQKIKGIATLKSATDFKIEIKNNY